MKNTVLTLDQVDSGIAAVEASLLADSLALRRLVFHRELCKMGVTLDDVIAAILDSKGQCVGVDLAGERGSREFFAAPIDGPNDLNLFQVAPQVRARVKELCQLSIGAGCQCGACKTFAEILKLLEL